MRRLHVPSIAAAAPYVIGYESVCLCPLLHCISALRYDFKGSFHPGTSVPPIPATVKLKKGKSPLSVASLLSPFIILFPTWFLLISLIFSQCPPAAPSSYSFTSGKPVYDPNWQIDLEMDCIQHHGKYLHPVTHLNSLHPVSSSYTAPYPELYSLHTQAE